MKQRKLELLSPAMNAETAIQAILHGSDAVYIGPPSHGARKAASNSIEDIERVVDFAHQYRAKVYVTVNTIIYPEEIKRVENLIRELYYAKVDAIIVQDLGILRMKIPPISLHASTQCDIRTPEKAKFLEEIGFSQLVLARELTLREVKEIAQSVSIPIETFIHGALCVCYSGRCHASLATTGRSANRGECAQICRWPYTLKDAGGKVVSKDKYLLSLKDFNASHNLEELIDAGVSSFKIEGRLKDLSYVKNVTAFYNEKLNEIIAQNPQNFERSSFGKVEVSFRPRLDKSFNRGFTNYFLKERKPLQIASLLTPKSQGEEIGNIGELNNGDGISFYDRSGNFTGVNINKVEGNKIFTARKIDIPYGTKLFRTFDVNWNKQLASDTSTRKIGLKIEIDNSGVTAEDERGIRVKIPLALSYEDARKNMDYKSVFSKLGNTSYYLDKFETTLDKNRFYRISELTALRRNLIDLLDIANKATYPFEYRRKENTEAKYPYNKLDYRDNVANDLAEKFYKEHGVSFIEKAAERGHHFKSGDVLMTTRHCVLRELGLCKTEKSNLQKNSLKFPLFLEYDGGRLLLDFDCQNCEMRVLKS